MPSAPEKEIVMGPVADPAANQRLSAGRATFFLVMLMLLFGGLGWRLYDLQQTHHAEYAAAAQNFLDSDLSFTTRRGAILDARERELAVSVERKSCAIDPVVAARELGDFSKAVEKLRGALALTPAELDNLYRRAANPKTRFAWVRRFLTDAQAATVEKLRLPGVVLPTDYERRYPQKTVAASVVGFAGMDGGLEGVEKVCEPVLRGLDGKRAVWRDGVGRQLADDGEELVSDTPALNVVLTIDSYVQAIAEDELAKALAQFNAKSGCAVVMETDTGNVLAMAGLPSFDLNDPSAYPVANRLVQGIATAYEPGSIFKPMVMAAALDLGVVTKDTKIDCENGAWTMPGTRRTLHDTHSYGVLTATGVILKSSNIGIAKVAEMMGMPRLHRAIRAFGFGEPTGQPLAGEIGGKVYPLEKWTSFSRGSVPMGQEITVTPLQIAAAYCALGNGGVLYRPRLISRVVNADGKVVSFVKPEAVRRVLGPAASKAICEMLAVTVAEGTGKKAKSELYHIGGKTGTAQLAVNAAERAQGMKGYSPTRYIGSFAALAPIEKPRIAVLVSIREPDKSKGYYGGTVSAPATRGIIERTLRYYRVPTLEDVIARAE